MSEEEKEAIEYLNMFKSYGMIMGLKADKDIEIVLKLIEKQQKELDKYKILDNLLLVNKEEYEFIKNKDGYISKDKIKEKIKELENNKELYFEKTIIQGRIDLLKELLEEK